jgi:hypothetical protein
MGTDDPGVPRRPVSAQPGEGGTQGPRLRTQDSGGRINEIVLHKRGMTVDTALRLARHFGTTAEMWAVLQPDYDLRLVRYHKEKEIEREVETLAGLHPALA